MITSILIKETYIEDAIYTHTHTHTHIYIYIYICIKGSKIVLFAETWMREIFIQSEVNQKEKNKYHVVLLIYGISEINTGELINKAEIETQI